MSNNSTPTLQLLATGPSTQVDPHVKQSLELLALDHNLTAAKLLKVLDQCVEGALASDFVVSALDMLWKQHLKAENKTVDQGLAEATWRHIDNG